WGFVKRSLAIHDLKSGSGLIDRRKATEALWFDGVLPNRTEKYGEALRDQVLFRSKPGWRQREVVLILDDMAGEAISDPKMVTNENFPHFASLADVIYIVPAEDMSASIMEEFVSRLEQANAEGVPIDLSRTNLIFVISKIDQLEHGGPAEKDLFARILPHPDRYRLPQHGDRAELKAYIEEMEEVHHGIEDWLRTHKPGFFQFFNLFGSLRCCGISALGIQPTKEPQGNDYEFTLAFRPEPVRVVDPIFWLLKENGLIHF
ncbi:MAG TPA: hypothetical protein VLV54_05535, partial [Thermoanaerobaculia bacterium]|nr:hypothetical protein [Thermoanaerobaculia bacterium]